MMMLYIKNEKCLAGFCTFISYLQSLCCGSIAESGTIN